MTNAIAKSTNGHPSVTFGNVMDNIFQNTLSRFFDDNFWETEGSLKKGGVPVNVRENEQQYEMDVVAPGCRKEDFKINIGNNQLTVSFEHKDENREQNEKAGWVRNEYLQRSFSRSFTLDDTVDVDKIQASYTDGILRIVMPKNEKSKNVSRNIEIQ